MITQLRTRYAVRRGQPLAEVIETRHGGKWRKGAEHTQRLADIGQLASDGVPLDLLAYVREIHTGALAVAGMVAEYRAGRLSGETKISNHDAPVRVWSDQWDSPHHLMATVSRMDLAGALRYFAEHGVPGWAHASSSNALIDSSSEAAMRPHPDDPTQRQLADPDYLALPVAGDVVLLGDDGTGMDATAETDHATLAAYDADIERIGKHDEDTTSAERARAQFLEHVTARHNERTTA